MSVKTINYLRSLATLAPKEIIVGGTEKQPLLWSLKANLEEFIDGKLSEPDQDELLPHLLRCIEARGWRSHLCTNELGISTCKIVVGDHEFTSDYSNDELDQLDFDPVGEKESRAEVVLYAYVKALAAQRKIAELSRWRHFKGDRMKVLCEASWVPRIREFWGDRYYDANFCCEWALEDEPQKKAQLWHKDGIWLHISELAGIRGDRVFYMHNSKGFARLKDDFLGVVGPKYPEMEGCLRFVEARNE